MTTNVPEIQFTPQGLILPSEQDILNGVLKDFNIAFGGNINQSLETPQGQLASSIAAVIANKNNQIAWLINNLDPTFSEGVMQDAIGKIYFIERKGRINSTATCTFIGNVGTLIPKGFMVKDTFGNIWTLDSDITISASGNVDGQMTAQGVYTAEAGEISDIYQSLVGLDRVYNKNDAIPGVETESASDFAERYKNSVAINAQGMTKAVYANIAELSGVSDCYVIDNPTNKTIKYGETKYPIKPHSVYVAVVGGDDDEIAKTIWTYSGNGCDFNGNTKVIVTDDTYDVPKPTYEIYFMRPVNAPLYFQVKIKNGLINEYIEEMKEAIKSAFNQASKHRIGKVFYAVNYVSSIIDVIPKGYLLDLKVSIDGVKFGEYVQLGIDQNPVISSENISVVFV